MGADNWHRVRCSCGSDGSCSKQQVAVTASPCHVQLQPFGLADEKSKCVERAQGLCSLAVLSYRERVKEESVLCFPFSVFVAPLMYEWEDEAQNVHVCSQNIFSPLKEGGEISLNGDVSVRSSSAWTFFLHVWVFGPAV